MTLSYGYPNDGAPNDSDYILYNLDPNVLNGKQLIPGPGIAITVMGSSVVVSNTGGGGGSTQTYITELDERATLPGSLRVIQGANMLITVNNTNGTMTFSSTASGGGGSGSQSFITVNNESGTLAGGRQFVDGANMFSVDGGPGTTFTTSILTRTTSTAASVTLTSASNTIQNANTVSNGIIYTLPVASTCPNKVFIINRVGYQSYNGLEITAQGSDQIFIEANNGVTNFFPVSSAAAIIIQSDGSNWYVVQWIDFGYNFSNITGNLLQDPFYYNVDTTSVTLYNYQTPNRYAQTSSGNITYTLDLSSNCQPKIFRIKNIGTGQVIINTSGGDTIDGASSYTLSILNSEITVQAIGSGSWEILNLYIPGLQSTSSIDTGTVNLTESSDSIRFANAAGGNMTYNLPAISGALDKEFTIKKIDSSVNTVTIVPNGSDNLEGANSSFIITIQGVSRTLHAGSNGWWIL